MKRSISLVLALVLALGLTLTGCGPKTPAATPAPGPETTAAPVPAVTPEPAPEPTPEPTPQEPAFPVKLAVLSGPTGVGAAKLLADQENGVESPFVYDYTVAADNQQVTAGLLNGEFDMAALATNVAANLYHKSEGKIQIAAVNTLGVLYILGKGIDDALDTSSLAGLRGKTIYATGQGANPEYVLNYLLTENGLDPKKDVNIVWQAAEEVTATMLQAQDAAYCMLPVPAATALTAKSEGNIQPVYDLSAEWDKLDNGSQLTMGCLVVRTQFAQEHPEKVEEFLAQYAASIQYVKENPEEAAQWVADLAIAPSAPIARKAIPQCNLVCITGEDMRYLLQGYYGVLAMADPSSIGGGIPDDAFYFLGN